MEQVTQYGLARLRGESTASAATLMPVLAGEYLARKNLRAKNHH
jgi:hypothetical protein